MQAGSITVNGHSYVMDLNDDRRLLDWLRDEQGLMGTKKGCATGHCGTCSVIVDGQLKRSCLLRLRACDGASVTTIEGVATAQGLHAVQYAFIQSGAVQCGFCTPGMILATLVLLQEKPGATRDDAAAFFHRHNNVCRCTGYEKIFRAVELAADLMRRFPGRYYPVETILSECAGKTNQPVADLVAKVCGSMPFADDVRVAGTLWGKLCWSAHPRAEVVRLDVSRAQGMPGVRRVLCAADVPGQNVYGPGKDEPVFAKQAVNALSDVLAVVLAETEEQAAAACACVEVEYAPLDGVFSWQEAAAADAPQIHADGNVAGVYSLARGDVDAALAGSDLVVSGVFEAPKIEHGYLEPEAGWAEPDGQGGVLVEMASHDIHRDRAMLARMLDLPLEQVRVRHAACGGSFGGKDALTLQPYLALGAWVTGCRVQMTMTRAESMRKHPKRHPLHMDIQVGFSRYGVIQGAKTVTNTETGAYKGVGPFVLRSMVFHSTGSYYVPQHSLQGTCWYTNNVQCGAMRSFGVPQAVIAMEQMMDEAARKLGLNPFEIRRRNALRTGLINAGNHLFIPGDATLIETLDAMEAALPAVVDAAVLREGEVLGVGVASACKHNGYGFGAVEREGVQLEWTADGKLTIRTSHADFGQGAGTAYMQLVAEQLGVSIADVSVVVPDTGSTPISSGTRVCRFTNLLGNAVLEACRVLLQKRSDQPEATVRAEYFYTAPATAPTPKEALPCLDDEDFVPLRIQYQYSFTTQAAVVAVRRDTGTVRLLHMLSAADAGRVLCAQAVEGQLEGGLLMGAGYALSEAFHEKEGVPAAAHFGACGLLKAADAPPMQTLLLEVPDPLSEVGAKGVGETAVAAAAPAVLNAVYDALGVRIYRMPVGDQLRPA